MRLMTRLVTVSREIKSVTIWFQNKRQTERKSAANRESAANSRTASPSFSSGTGGSSRCASALGSRPSLDRIASRTELRNHPRTPTRRHTTSGDGMYSSNAIWDHMPSSPLVPVSPAATEYIDFTKNARSKRTLEWACAAARVADKDQTSQRSHHHHREHRDSLPSHHYSSHHSTSTSSSHNKHRVVHRQVYEPHSHPEVTPKGMPMDLELTDSESDEAITPPSTWGRDDPRWSGAQSGHGMKKSAYPSPATPVVVDDDDMMKAALALCGLGAGRRVVG